MSRRALVMSWIAACALAVPVSTWAEQPSVQVEPPDLHGSRAVEPQTQTAVIRDYLESWQSLRTAMQQNRPGLLDPDFSGTAREKLADTIQEQIKLGVQTRYQDRSHDLQIVFYSPEGLSLQMIDTVDYDQQVVDRGKSLTTEHVHARYLVVMTPAEARWQVRIFQAEPAH